jgi:hypothetical protein
MRIECIYVSGWRGDLPFTQCCIASIRQWYPRIRICLIKDELHGPYDTSELERAFDVKIFNGAGGSYGWGAGKLEPLFQSGRERGLLIDSDVVFIGPVLKHLERFEEDFVVVNESHPMEEITANYFDPQAVERAYPRFRFPGYVFNTGQIVASSGILKRSDFEPFVSFSQPPRFLKPDLFKAGEQGLLNFVLLSKHQEGALSLRRAYFMRWPPGMKDEEVEVARLGSRSTYDFMLHWAGKKNYGLEDAPLNHVLRHFDAIYKQRAAGRGLWRRLRALFDGRGSRARAR